ncbi:MAG: hypothetical protein AB1489_42865 [Acidobacteriota bacterium]
MITIVGLFDDELDAHKAVQRLMDVGIKRDNIVLMTNAVESTQHLYVEPEGISSAANRVDIDANIDDYASHLKELNVPEQNANLLDQAVRQGQTLVAISTDENMEEFVVGVINLGSGKNISKFYRSKSRHAVM